MLFLVFYLARIWGLAHKHVTLHGNKTIAMKESNKIQSDNIFMSIEKLPMSITRLGKELILCDDIDREDNYLKDELDFLVSGSIKATNLFGIVVCLRGYIEIEWGGKTFIMEPGDMTFLRSGSIGGLVNYSYNVRSFCILAQEDFFMPDMTPAESAEFHSKMLVKPYCYVGEEGLESIKTLYFQIKKTLQNQDRITYVRRIVTGMLQSLTFICLSIFQSDVESRKTIAEKSHQDSVYQLFLKLVQIHYTKHNDIKFYADKLCITPKYLSQIVHQSSGQHAKTLLEDYRLNEAKSLLKSQKYNVNEVSEMLSFASPSHFCQYFKKKTNMTPLQYQRG